MTGLIASPRQELPKKLPALPVIEHPALRRSDENNADLQIRGNSREESTSGLEEIHDALPPLKRRIKQQASQGHSRVLTWPIGESYNSKIYTYNLAILEPTNSAMIETANFEWLLVWKSVNQQVAVVFLLCFFYTQTPNFVEVLIRF